jgi:2-oxoglutarate dehydrogenase E2 component (dihydrolipoamide succinyltransferase)
VLREIRVENGATVRSGDLLAILDAGEARAAAAPPAVAAATATAAVVPARAAGKAGPGARRMAAESGLDTARIIGSGRDGRVLKADVAAEAARAAPATPPPSAAPGPAPVATRPAVPGSREERRVPMSRLRARIAERMVEAQQNAAMLTTFNEVDLGEVMALRSRHRDAFEKQHGVKLGFMSFFIKASIEALRRFPVINASVEGNDVIYHDYFDVGIAVSTDRGLIVPVVRDADQLSFGQLEAAITEYGRRARDGSIGMDDLTGGTFTITNGGIFGSLLSTPILNPPQSGILGMHKIQERPVVMNGQVVARPMMYLALTYDHRIVDGREAVTFLVRVKESLEDPARLVLDL